MESSGSADRDAERILGLLAEPDRMRVVAALVLGYSRIDDIARVSGVPPRALNGAVARLVAADLVVEDGASGYRFAIEELKVAARSAAAARPGTTDIDAPARAARILRSFLRDGQSSCRALRRLLDLSFRAGTSSR